MKNQINTLFVVIAFSLAANCASHAMSSLVSLSQQPLWPVTSNPDGNLIYEVTAVGRSGAGLLEVTLTAGNMPPGVTVTFSPSVLRFTGIKLVAQTARMTVSCPGLTPIDCYPFTLTGTAQHESVTITNPVCYTPNSLANRRATLILDGGTNSNLAVRGAGATGGIYQIEASTSLSSPHWTPMGPSTADGNGRFIYFTSKGTNQPARFFRSVEVNLPMATH